MSNQSRLRVPIHAGHHARGSENAPLVLLEYGDYQCPHCARGKRSDERQDPGELPERRPQRRERNAHLFRQRRPLRWGPVL